MISYDYRFRVRYKDIDRMGIMYYSRYFEYYEAARTDLMRALGLTYDALEKQGIFMPVVKAEASYASGVEFDDELIVRTRIQEIHRGRMEIHYSVLNVANPDKDLNTGKTIHAFVSNSGKTTRMPEALKTLLDAKWGHELTDE